MGPKDQGILYKLYIGNTQSVTISTFPGSTYSVSGFYLHFIKLIDVEIRTTFM